MLTLKIIVAGLLIMVITGAEHICRAIKEFLISVCTSLLPGAQLAEVDEDFLTDYLH